ncbi:MAG: glycosyltransferase [Thermoleophilia bacterium]|nr:glycosyltransferase [Thermoleophilia bacterium]
MTSAGAYTIVEIIVGSFLVVFATGYVTLLVRAIRATHHELDAERRRSWGMDQLAVSPAQPMVTIVVPAHQEQASIVGTVRSLLAQRWHRFEVIVVPNGCTDRTVRNLHDAFDLASVPALLERPPGTRGRIRDVSRSRSDPRLTVIETSGGGKADAVNCALERASGEFCLLVDADSMLAPHAVARSILPFVELGDQVAGVSASIRVLNGATVTEDGSVRSEMPRSRLARMQLVEYSRAFHIGRAGWASLGALPVVSGAFGMYRTSVLRAVGGLDTTTVGEDLELVLRLHARVRRSGRRPQLVHLAEPLCWTEVPEDLASLRAQRIRWHRGLAEVVRLHGSMMFNARHGTVGLLSMPFLGLFELFAPLVELLGLAALSAAATSGALSWTVVVALGSFAVLFGMALSMGAVLLEQVWGRGFALRPSDVWTLAGAALLEQFGHRQRTAAWRIRGLLAGMWSGLGHPTDPGSSSAWGEMHHRGARSVTGS